MLSQNRHRFGVVLVTVLTICGCNREPARPVPPGGYRTERVSYEKLYSNVSAIKVPPCLMENEEPVTFEIPGLVTPRQALSFEGEFRHVNKLVGASACFVRLHALDGAGERTRVVVTESTVAKGQGGILKYYVELKIPEFMTGRGEIEISFPTVPGDFDPRTFDPKTMTPPSLIEIVGAVGSITIAG